MRQAKKICKTLTSVVAFLPYFFLSQLSFPVFKLPSFRLNRYNQVTVRWEVQGEADVKGYEVQRGLNERDFSKVAFVDFKQSVGTTNRYEYIDQSVFKQQNANGRTYYYRLKVTRNNGSFEYSKAENVTQPYPVPGKPGAASRRCFGRFFKALK